MRKKKPSLNSLIASSAGSKLLFLGRESIFSKDEISRFLKKKKIEISKNYEEGVVAVVEHHNLNPVEEDISNLAYENHIPLYALNEFEKLLSDGINDDELLMVIKLTNDQERIFRLLGNEHISEELFIKLLMMYEWHDDDEDNRDDRDTIMFTLKRYIEIRANNTDLLYSYLTLRRLVIEATNPKLLLALIGFQNFAFHIRGKEKVTLRELIARNEYLNKEVISKLVSLRDKKVDVALASNRSVDLLLLKNLLAKKSEKINEALAINKNIDNEIFNTLLTTEDKSIQLLLWSQSIDIERLALIDTYVLDEKLFATIGANESLNSEVIEKLLVRDNEELICYLAENPTLSEKQLETIYAKQLPSTYAFLARNPASTVEMLELLYQTYNLSSIRIALAHNKRTPEAILRTLFERDEFEIHQSMASNASVPLDILDSLKVDTRLQNELSKNKIFEKAYKVVFEYD